MKKIIIKNKEGGIKIVYPNPKKYGEGKLPIEECKALDGLFDDDWFVTDQEIDKSDMESRKQLYLDGETIKKDLTWEKRLMPDHIIKKRELSKLNDKIKLELDPAKKIGLFLELEEMKKKKAGSHNEDVFWSEIALAGLETASMDKPDIKKKLQDKIKELKG